MAHRNASNATHHEFADLQKFDSDKNSFNQKIFTFFRCIAINLTPCALPLWPSKYTLFKVVYNHSLQLYFIHISFVMSVIYPFLTLPINYKQILFSVHTRIHQDYGIRPDLMHFPKSIFKDSISWK